MVLWIFSRLMHLDIPSLRHELHVEDNSASNVRMCLSVHFYPSIHLLPLYPLAETEELALDVQKKPQSFYRRLAKGKSLKRGRQQGPKSTRRKSLIRGRKTAATKIPSHESNTRREKVLKNLKLDKDKDEGMNRAWTDCTGEDVQAPDKEKRRLYIHT